MSRDIVKLTIKEHDIDLIDNLHEFPNLQILDCSFNKPLEKLDLSQVPNLQELNCSYNNFEELDFSPVPNLQVLNCSHNFLRSLDLSHLLTYAN